MTYKEFRDLKPGMRIAKNEHCDDPLVVEENLYYEVVARWEKGGVQCRIPDTDEMIQRYQVLYEG